MLRARGFALASLILAACDVPTAEPASPRPVEPAPSVQDPVVEPVVSTPEREPDEPAPSQEEVVARPRPRSEAKPGEPCCRTCKKGKACGDSCIARTSTCEKPPGCACDAERADPE